MISRRRKKPPDRTNFSLQSNPCISHRPPFALLSSSIYPLPQSFASGQHFRLICGSQRNFARSRDDILVDFRRFALSWSSLARCSNLLRSRLLIRTLRVSTLKPVLAAIVDVIAHLGFVGVTLVSSKAVLIVSPDWQLPPVSPQFRLLVFRSAPQVSFLPLFFSPLWFICCFGSYALGRRSKPTLIQLGYWFNPDNVLFSLCWTSTKLGYYQDIRCWKLDQFVTYNLLH